MAKCYYTGMHKRFGQTRSHALNSSKRTWKPNLQRRHMMIDGRMQTVMVSTRALRTLAKER